MSADVSERGWPVRAVTEADWADVRALFARVFGTTLPPVFQHWKYGDGRGVAMGVWQPDGSLVGHYGGGFRPMAYRGDVVRAVQMQDVMVAPEGRDVLARMGPFGRMTLAATRSWLGSEGGSAFGFGFPSARHLRLGRRLGLYQPLDRVDEWAWDLQAAGVPMEPGSRLSAVGFDWGSRTDWDRLGVLGARWSPAARGWLAGVRDVDWWRHRFANHPVHRHAAWWLTDRETSEEAWVVVRVCDEATWELLDWIAPDSPRPTWLEGLFLAAAQARAEHLRLWCTPAAVAAWPKRWLDAGRRTQACELAVTHEVLMGHPTAFWAERVWMTGGDTDFR